MTRLIYARSLVPSDASISLRISSNDDAIASTSASLRCAYSATSAMATLHHIPTGRWGDASHEKAGRSRPNRARRRTCGRATQRLTPSLGPRRLPHRRRHNVSITTRNRIVGGLWHSELIAVPGRFGVQIDTRDTPASAATAPPTGYYGTNGSWEVDHPSATGTSSPASSFRSASSRGLPNPRRVCLPRCAVPRIRLRRSALTG